jgi:outer membrane lipoprotein-sorting protein
MTKLIFFILAMSIGLLTNGYGKEPEQKSSAANEAGKTQDAAQSDKGSEGKTKAAAKPSLLKSLQKAFGKTGKEMLMKDAEKAPEEEATTPFKDEPAGRELYKEMIEAMRKADALSYVSRYTMHGKGGFRAENKYRAWLKKPNYFRVEVESSLGKKSGILIGDGKKLWIYWPEGRFQSRSEDQKEYEKTRMTSYMTKSAGPGGHSIGHETCYIGIGMPILDPSTFHGYTDSLQAYLDGVMVRGSEKVGNEDCDKIEVSIMKHQRSWYLWISKKDRLPRKLKQIVRVSYDIVMEEEWSEVTINGEIPEKLFAWKPPKGWTEWKRPPLEAGLLKPGTVAPDFKLTLSDGEKIKLSDLRGSIVWLYVWRAG